MSSHLCPACQKVQGSGDDFCVECGTQLLPLRYCDACGVMINHTGEFCRECGARAPAVPPPAPAPSPTSGAPPSTPDWLKEPAPPPTPTPARPPAPLSPSPLPARGTARKGKSLARGVDRAPVSLGVVPPARPLGPVAVGFTLIGAAVGLLGLALAGTQPLAALFFLSLMLLMAGRALRQGAIRTINGLIDWLWEDPVLRRRLLKE